MKKLIVLLLVGMLSLSAFGCGKKKEGEKKAEPEKKTEQPAEGGTK